MNRTTYAFADELVKLAAPWDRENPKRRSTPLTAGQRASAKARARAAGRPYPNLVDNMAAGKKRK